jgi:hypothetical protein
MREWVTIKSQPLYKRKCLLRGPAGIAKLSDTEHHRNSHEKQNQNIRTIAKRFFARSANDNAHARSDNLWDDGAAWWALAAISQADKLEKADEGNSDQSAANLSHSALLLSARLRDTPRPTVMLMDALS